MRDGDEQRSDTTPGPGGEPGAEPGTRLGPETGPEPGPERQPDLASEVGHGADSAASTDQHGEPHAETEEAPEEIRGRRLAVLSLAALGVVYGDIGTSPLYAIRECFFGEHSVPPDHANVLGVLSLIFWSLIVVVSVKYLVFILRANNRGEGGILALVSLIHPEHAPGRVAAGRSTAVLVSLGLFGAALLYGDGMITPAISVLSAVEGLEVAAPHFAPWVLPVTLLILVALFAFQRRGTAGVGAIFGPVTLVWFAVLAALGVVGVVHHPQVLTALDPSWGLGFFLRNGDRGFLVLGAVFLVVTGGEALYADMGHFGSRPIRLTWFTLVLPALLLNYFGQGALLLADPTAAHNPFYRLAPAWAIYPLVALSTAATVIASQAVISGAFSLTRQAVQLGYVPRLTIRHTSATEIGQIYIPAVNWVLMVATLGLVLGFGSSSRLAAAYGVAVTTTMVLTTVIFYVVARRLWEWTWWTAGLLCAGFLVVDLSFFGASMIKVEQGGWFPLLVAVIVFTLLTTWWRGRQILASRLREGVVEVEEFLRQEGTEALPRVPGTAVFLTGSAQGIPPTLLLNIKHNRCLHERVVLLTVITRGVPRVRTRERLEITDLGSGIYRVVGSYGFMESPDVPHLLGLADRAGLDVDRDEVSYFLGRQRLLSTPRPGMARWRERLFALMSRNSRDATAYYGLPASRVIEIGSQVEL